MVIASIKVFPMVRISSMSPKVLFNPAQIVSKNSWKSDGPLLGPNGRLSQTNTPQGVTMPKKLLWILMDSEM